MTLLAGVQEKTFKIIFLLFAVFFQEVFIGRDPGLGFCSPALWRHVDPFKLPLQGLLAFGFGFLFLGQAFLLLVQPGGIIASRDAFSRSSSRIIGNVIEKIRS
jgi:hypothetical protein